MMITKDERSLERYIDVHILIPDLDLEKWELFFRNVVNIVIEGFLPNIDKDELSSISEAFYEICSIIKPILITPRQIKSFGRHLFEKLNSPAITINFVDLFCLTVIQASNPRLYSWLSDNRLLLIDPNSSSSEYWAMRLVISRVSGKKDLEEQRYESFTSAIKKIDFCSSDERNLIEYILGHRYFK